MEEVRNVKDPLEIFRDIKESQLLISWKLVILIIKRLM